MSNCPNVLIIDDEPDIRELLEITLGRMRLNTDSASNLQEARSLLSSCSYNLCLTDMRLPDGSGLELVEYIQQHLPHLPVAMITAHGSVEVAIDALKAGAFDFLTKPVDLSRLRSLVNNALRVPNPSHVAQSTSSDSRLLGQSPAVLLLRKQIDKLARSQAPVYISGESGTGKELVARLIHEQGPRSSGPFVPVNCGAIPDELVESELFGHKKGSFTGAQEEKPGLFQAAQGGTLFLDEVADLPMSAQVKMLRAIQEKAVRPVGSQRELPVDVRILCATHKNLATEVADKRFRQDLYYRLNVIELQVPPLRQRPGDIALLTEHILHRLAQADGIAEPKLAPDVLPRLAHYSFPGNIRELENMLERALILCEEQCICLHDLRFADELEHPPQAIPLPSPLDTAQNTTAATPTSLDQVNNLEDHLLEVERQLIMQALEETRWNRTAAAQRLGLTFRSMRYRLKKLGLE